MSIVDNLHMGVDEYFEWVSQSQKSLLKNIKKYYKELTELRDKLDKWYGGEDLIYRFYHGSFKVYGIQELTQSILEVLEKISPKGCRLDYTFINIMYEGGAIKPIEWELSHNNNWSEITRPMLEAYFHAKYMLDMCIKYRKELGSPPEILPSGWACLLSIYGII